MLDRFRDRPLLAALLIGIAAQLLFSVRLGIPDALVFDEVHYVPAARAILALSHPLNTEHPMLGKELIALGIALAGDNAVGWRLTATLAGTATVLGAFGFVMLLTAKVRVAALAAVLVAFNQTLFVQARTAMLDVYLGAFVMLGIAALLWAMRAPPPYVKWRWALGSALLGAAVAVKWAAVPYIVFAGLAFLIVRLRDARIAGRPRASALAGGGQRHWPGLGAVAAALILGTVSVAVYFLTFIPAFFFATDAVTLSGLLPLQAAMWESQTQVLARHPYQSASWTWPLMIRPIWYFYEPNMQAIRGILLIGNPVVMWGGLVAVAACLWAWRRDRAWQPLTAALIWAASWLVWVIIPKSLGFYYYYHLSGVFVAIAIAVALDHYRMRRDWAVALAAAAMFAWFYPIIAAMPLADDQGFRDWMWFSSWR